MASWTFIFPIVLLVLTLMCAFVGYMVFRDVPQEALELGVNPFIQHFRHPSYHEWANVEANQPPPFPTHSLQTFPSPTPSAENQPSSASTHDEASAVATHAIHQRLSTSHHTTYQHMIDHKTGMLHPHVLEGLNFSVLEPAVRPKWEEWVRSYRMPPPPRNNPWDDVPRADLWVRTFTPGADKLLTILYESMELFWPKYYGNLVVLLDDENQRDHQFGHLLERSPPFPVVRYQPEPDWTNFPAVICGRTRGYDRQMYSGFYADLFSDAPFIGLVDNDALFVAPTLPSHLFDPITRRPIVIAKVTRYSASGVPYMFGPVNGRWAYATEAALGHKQIADFMWNFPVIIRREAFAAVRAFIAARYNATFEQAFKIISATKGSYCQINIILNYEWYYAHSQYKWHIQSVLDSEKIFNNGTYNFIKARTATHARGLSSNDIYAYIRQGYCIACSVLDNCVDRLTQEKRDQISHSNHMILFNWIKTSHMWVERGQKTQYQTQMEYYEELRHFGFEWTPNLPTILAHRVHHHVDCELTIDDQNCVEYNEKMHRKHFQKVAAHLKPKHYWLPLCVSTYASLVPNAEAFSVWSP